MDLFEAIGARYSYRGEFRDTPVPREDLEKIVQAGIQAPSGCNAQTVHFVIVDDADLIDRIAGIVGVGWMRTAAAVIVCVMETRPVYRELSFGVEDCAAAVENMLLAITALGYAALWYDGALRNEGKAERIASLLRVGEAGAVRVIIPLGSPRQGGQQNVKKPFGERAWFNRYGGNEPA